jgi:outer membrane receptor protein involved in Fe transport
VAKRACGRTWTALGGVVATLTCAPLAWGADESGGVGVEDVVVKGQLLHTDRSAFSATGFDADAIRTRRLDEVEDLLRDVPGMNVRDFGLGGVANAIAVRGFGNGGHGGDLGVVLDGVPLNEANSHADGYVDLGVIVPLEVGVLTVYRGPVSALYGNFNRGGLIAVETRKSGEYLEVDASAGEFGTVDLQGALGRTLGGAGRLNAAVQAYRTDGYRPQSKSESVTVAGRLAAALSERLDAAVSARWNAGESESAAYLSRAQFAVDPYGVDPRVRGDGSEKTFGTLRLDLAYGLADDLRLLGFVYGTRQDFTRWFTRPVSATTWRQREETYDRDVFGLGANLNGRSDVGGRPVAFVLGVEGFEETTEFQFFEGSVNRVRQNPPTSDRESRIESVSVFAEVEAAVAPRLDLSLGVRADRFSGACARLGPETGSDPCATFENLAHVSPKVGARLQVLPGLKLRASFAEGFALPNGFIKYATSAQDLDVNLFRQTEIGARFAPGAGFDLDVALYRSESSDEVRTVAPGLFENFGRTERRGLEAALNWRPAESVEVGAVYARTDSEIEESGAPALVGKRVPAVPDETLTLNALWRVSPAFAVDATWRRVGESAIDAANTRFSAAYEVVDLGVGYAFGGEHGFRLYAELNNLFDQTHATAEFVIGGQDLVAPGAPRTFRVGVQADF